jgi:dihydroorotate dehydrogenase electron transfer subunit
LHQCYRLETSKKENYRTRTLVFDRPCPAQPGQFVMVWLPGIGEKPYCVTNDQPLTLTVVRVGPFSTALSALKTGETAWVRGPFGHGYQLLGERLFLVGGGYGVASLLFLAQQTKSQNRQIEVCIGAGSARDILLLDQFEARGLHVQVVTEDGSLGKEGLVTDLAVDVIHEMNPDWLYACGPPAMLKAVSRLCHTHHVSHQLSWEAMISCGLGLCGQCESAEYAPWLPPGWLVCQDGPVQIVKI